MLIWNTYHDQGFQYSWQGCVVLLAGTLNVLGGGNKGAISIIRES